MVVLDVGKTNAKLTLWDREGRLLERHSRANDVVNAPQYRALDAHGIEAWTTQTLAGLARRADISVIVPVAHGAAAALVRPDELFTPPMDYEDEPSARERSEYDTQRDAFMLTGSPALPLGLNLGMQLHRLESLTGPWPDDLFILLWPQYWAWRLTGVPAAEVTSLGCHSDLWHPLTSRYSELAERRGWARRMPPLRHASAPLAKLSPQWVARTGLPEDCVVLCGLHDSNAALLAARGHAEISGKDATVLSTGTWFVAMRSPVPGARVEPQSLLETRDCLINVDVDSKPIPSARFMGGREAELLTGVDVHAPAYHEQESALIGQLPSFLETGAVALPSFVSGCGPFPGAVGRWINKPQATEGRRALVYLYLALMTDAALNLIGSQDRLLVEGRFAEARLFTRALATLRPRQTVLVSNTHTDVSYGALRLIYPDLAPAAPLTAMQPLDVNFNSYAEAWRMHARRSVA